MNKSSFDIHKNTRLDNDLDWLKHQMFIEYGYITKVYDANTVEVELDVQSDISVRTYNVRLLYLGSKVREETTRPVLHDHVLLLFLRQHNDAMFFDVDERIKRSGSATIYDENCNNYNMFSGIGVLLKTTDGRSFITSDAGVGEDGAYLNEVFAAKVAQAFQRAVSVVFDSPLTDPAATPEDAPVDITFGKRSPLTVEHRAAVTKTIGVDHAESGDTEFEAPVNIELGSTSPVDVKSKSAITLSFDEASLVKMGDKFELQIKGDLVLKSDGKVTIDGSEVILNGASTHATQFEALSQQWDLAIAAINAAFASKLNGAGAPGSIVSTIASAKVEKVKL